MKEYIQEYKNYLLIDKKYSDNTISSYLNDLKKFDKFTNKKVNKVTKQDILNFLESEEKIDKDKTVAHSLTTIRCFYKFLETIDVIKESPADYIDSLKLRKILPVVLSKEEVEQL